LPRQGKTRKGKKKRKATGPYFFFPGERFRWRWFLPSKGRDPYFSPQVWGKGGGRESTFPFLPWKEGKEAELLRRGGDGRGMVGLPKKRKGVEGTLPLLGKSWERVPAFVLAAWWGGKKEKKKNGKKEKGTFFRTKKSLMGAGPRFLRFFGHQRGETISRRKKKKKTGEERGTCCLSPPSRARKKKREGGGVSAAPFFWRRREEKEK